MVLPDALDTSMFIRFLRQLIRNADRKVFLMVDNLRVHKGKKVREWIEANRDRIEVFYLPPYAPGLNPDEYLNNDLKQDAAKRATARTKADLMKTAKSHLKSLQRRPERVQRFFRHPRVAYAA
jgi:transposase